MQLRCLIVDTDKQFYDIAAASLSDMSIGEIHFASTIQDGLQEIHKVRPNLVFIRCGAPDASFEALFHVVKRLKVHAALIPVISSPTKETLAEALKQPGVVDLIAGELSVERIRQVAQRAIDRLFGAQKNDRSKHYRAFAVFVGVTPTLSHRKILSETSLGLIHNRSLRLAIEYWRKNPATPIAALGLNPKATFSSLEELSDKWSEFDLMPWEVAMFEAQIFFMAYWREAIAHKIMPPMIPTLLQIGGDELNPLPPQLQSEVLSKIEEMTRRGEVQETLQAMGVALRGDDTAPSQMSFSDFMHALDHNLSLVDRKLPHLIRPSEEAGYESFKPDKAEPSKERANRMVFTQRNNE